MSRPFQTTLPSSGSGVEDDKVTYESNSCKSIAKIIYLKVTLIKEGPRFCGLFGSFFLLTQMSLSVTVCETTRLEESSNLTGETHTLIWSFSSLKRLGLL